MSIRYDELFGQIVEILRRDWAGKDLLADRFDPRYYNTAIGQAWHDHKLDGLLFLRYLNQMLAVTGDRHLRLAMRPSERYAPWSPGFHVRRYGNALYVTETPGETRLAPGDRITHIQGGTPAEHRANIQKNFFYADDPAREDWRGFLKMADTVGVGHPDGTTETLVLSHHAPEAPKAITIREYAGGIVLDLRNAASLGEYERDDLLSLLCRKDTPLSALTEPLCVNYTRLNCLIWAAALHDDPDAAGFLDELRGRIGRGFLPEPADDGVIPGRAPARVAVLLDTWTRDDAEALALAAKRAGIPLIGRPTLGTLDLADEVHYELDERYVLTWPTAISQAAYAGRPLGPVEPDEIIPWTPEECTEDLLLRRAEEYIKE